MVISPLNHMFWRSVVEAILIDRHMLFYGKLLVFMQKVALILFYNKKISWIRGCSRNEGVCIRHRLGILVRTPSIKGKNRLTAQLTWNLLFL